MKLNKNICKECNEKSVFKGMVDLICGWSMSDEKRWEKGVVYCPMYMTQIDIGNINENCKYKLEQMVINQNETQ